MKDSQLYQLLIFLSFSLLVINNLLDGDWFISCICALLIILFCIFSWRLLDSEEKLDKLERKLKYKKEEILYHQLKTIIRLIDKQRRPNKK